MTGTGTGTTAAGLTGSVRALLAEARAALPGAEAALEAEILLAHCLGCARVRLYAAPEAPVAPAQAARFGALVAGRAAGTPIAYLTGEREFWSLALAVNRHTLIPRPETEGLVEEALRRLPPGGPPGATPDGPLEILDLGTGSGAIALALARERPAARITATDRSPEALAVAAANATRLGLARIRFRQGDWYTAVAGRRFHLICANPPYVAAGDPALAEGELTSEPIGALVAGADGLAALRAIIEGGGAHLRPGGWILLEHGHDQAAAVGGMLAAAGFREIGSHADLAGIPRIAAGRWPG
jgi:release factor glutamine methyltransferase